MTTNDEPAETDRPKTGYGGFDFGPIVEPISGRVWAPKEIAGMARRRAARLGREGVSRGDRVLIHYGNRGEFFADLLAVWNLGACAIPLDPRLTSYEVLRIAALAKPRLSLFESSPPPGIETGLAELGAAAIDLAEQDPDGDSVADWHLDDYALILFTSGTTGEPKGVVHTHRSLAAQWDSLRVALAGTDFRRTLCLLPTHFGHGLICNCLFPWLAGNTLHILPPFRADSVARLGALIDEHAITFMSSVPTIWRLALKLANAPERASLDRVFCGSAPLSGHLWDEIRRWTGAHVSNAYGITETASWLAGTPRDVESPADGFIGEPWGSEIRILDAGDTKQPIDDIPARAAGEEGHVWVRTPALMQGYYQREDLTREVVRQGWFYTGDIGLLDEHGRLCLRGREREEINKGGMKIHPADVDSVIEQFPSVADVCAFACEDELLGEDVGIAIVIDENTESTRSELLRWAQQRLANHKIPSRWYVLDEIPRTSRGKINRQTVARHCAGIEAVSCASARHSTSD